MAMNPQDFIESDNTFRNQFNVSHPDFHAGDPTPVPIGGKRIPIGCTETTEDALTSSTIPLQVASEYARVENERESLKKFRASVLLIGKLVGFVSQQQTIVKCNIMVETQKLKDELVSLKHQLDVYMTQAESTTKDDVIGAIQLVLDSCVSLPSTKEGYGDFILRIQGVTSRLFIEMTRLLAILKKMKGIHTDKTA